MRASGPTGTREHCVLWQAYRGGQRRGVRGEGGAALTLMPSQEKSVRVCCEEKRRGSGYPGHFLRGLSRSVRSREGFSESHTGNLGSWCGALGLYLRNGGGTFCESVSLRAGLGCYPGIQDDG